ncbi:hypothetical protein KJZ67_00030 [Patescibacteria group bacterium]|nr:hypothetical protein [Patescibacteria group bacterium]
MDIIFYSCGLIFITLWLIIKGYEYYKIIWPLQYFGPEDKANIFISSSPIRYLSFRLLPTFTAVLLTHSAFFKASLVDENPLHIASPIFLGFVTMLFYTIHTDGRVLLKLMMKSPDVEIYLNKITQAFIHLIIIGSLIGTGIFAGYLAMNPIVLRFTPDLYGLMDNIWAAFITIILFYEAKKFINRPKEIDFDIMIKRSASSISPSIIALIEEASIKNNADVILVKAICIAENIQRAKWVRRLESMIGIVKPVGTYGIMQVHSKKPISDEESVKQAITNFFVGTANMDFQGKMKSVESYNRNQKYLYLVEAIYNFISPINL